MSVSGKIFSFSMLIGGYLLLSCYCAVLISYLTVSTFVLPFDNIQGLIESNYELAQGKSANLQFMQDAPNDSCKCTERGGLSLAIFCRMFLQSSLGRLA